MQSTFLTVILARPDVPALRIGARAGAVAFVAALTAVAAQISIPLPFTPVPFTFQPMVVLVGAMALGARLGMASQLAYLAMGVLGLPVFAASPALSQGAARLVGPTGGYLMAYPVAALLVGWLAERGFDRRYLTSVAAMTAGLAIVFAGGVFWLGKFMPGSRGLAPALEAGFYPFVAADLIKLLLAALVMPRLWAFAGRHRG
jgi:biotin transport system substrate-specific component